MGVPRMEEREYVMDVMIRRDMEVLRDKRWRDGKIRHARRGK